MPAYPKLARWVRKASVKTSTFATWLSIQSGQLAFDPRPDDLFLASYARSGTTWLQMILYQLTTDGNMDFEHITLPIPYFERALGQGRDLNRLPSPRIFKTHFRYRKLPKGPYKRIYVARNGKDVLVSCYYFFRAHSPFKGTFDEFFQKFMAGNVPSGSWFRHVAEWSAHAADPNVLFLRYEDLVNDFERTLGRIVAFLGRLDSPGKIRLCRRALQLPVHEAARRQVRVPSGSDAGKRLHRRGRSSARARTGPGRSI